MTCLSHRWCSPFQLRAAVCSGRDLLASAAHDEAVQLNRRRPVSVIVLGITLVVAGCRGNIAEVPPSTVPVSTTSPISTTSVTQAPPSAPTTSTSTTTLLEPAFAEGAMFLWDTAWQIAAKADAEAMTDYVDRLAAARGQGDNPSRDSGFRW